ncbi:hypothetical protein MA16_Dca004221 [Dendrobium catenatum]|uniref:Uncharacterized protein n=1 Tax=Dendrobium catenatum TaxID=906689 RepID=A0A2I0W6U5_9ASPA|nr:hypothetical protein MA16_Dca004221 [Dendrobium catenatum]
MEAANNSSSIPFFPFLILLFIGFLILLIIFFRDLLQLLSSVRRYVSGNGGSALSQQSNEAGLYPTIIASFPMFYYSEVRRFMEGRNGGECAVRVPIRVRRR